MEPAVDRWYEQGLVAAFLNSVDGAIVVTRMLAVFVASALPYGVLVAGLVGIAIAIRRLVPSGGFPTIGIRDRLGRSGDEPETDGRESEDESNRTL